MTAADRTAPSVAVASAFFPPLARETTAAVIVVDVLKREVTFANELARELTPGLELPVSVDAWSVAAGLEDVTGTELPQESRPSTGPAKSLVHVAQGEPVRGEAVTAAHGTQVTAPREVLWALGRPMTDAPDSFDTLALVVFLPARDARLIAGAQESAGTLRDRAVLATRVSFTITDPAQEDSPLVWVNPAFTEATGYEFDEAVGRNCRFLQGPGTDRAVVDEIRQALADGSPITVTLLNYRKDHSAFWNELSISPVRDTTGAVTNFVGVQTDVTARVEAQLARDDALNRAAMAADRLALLAAFTSRLAMTQSPATIVDLLADMLVPRLGSWVAVYTLDDTGRLASPYLRHERDDTDERVAATVQRLREVMLKQLPDGGPIKQILSGASSGFVVDDYASAPAEISGVAADERTALLQQLGLRSFAAVPLVARSGILGAVVVATDQDRPPLGEPEVALLRDVALRAGLMLENAQLYTRERTTAATLQRSLLPRLPEIDGVEIAAAYVPAADAAAVGGDWYDVFPLRDGTGVGVVVGDVMGHNYDSAARMGKLSTIVRSYAWPGADPAATLTAVDDLLVGSQLDYMATCLYSQFVLDDDGAVLRYASAGHPPAVVRRPDGSTELLDGGRGAMIGIEALLPAHTRRIAPATLKLPCGSTLVCFTDGLTDASSADRDVDAGTAELRRVIEALPLDASPQQMVDAVTRTAHPQDDDIAVVAIRIC